MTKKHQYFWKITKNTARYRHRITLYSQKVANIYTTSSYTTEKIYFGKSYSNNSTWERTILQKMALVVHVRLISDRVTIEEQVCLHRIINTLYVILTLTHTHTITCFHISNLPSFWLLLLGVTSIRLKKMTACLCKCVLVYVWTVDMNDTFLTMTLTHLGTTLMTYWLPTRLSNCLTDWWCLCVFI